MKTQLPSKYPLKSSREPLGFANPRLRTTALNPIENLELLIVRRVHQRSLPTSFPLALRLPDITRQYWLGSRNGGAWRGNCPPALWKGGGNGV